MNTDISSYNKTLAIRKEAGEASQAFSSHTKMSELEPLALLTTSKHQPGVIYHEF